MKLRVRIDLLKRNERTGKLEILRIYSLPEKEKDTREYFKKLGYK